MKRLVLFLTLSFLWFGSVWADTFNPSTPPEPGVPNLKSRVVLYANPQDGGSVSGEGTYYSGNSVRVSANANTGFSFSCWTDAAGDTVSTLRSYTLIKHEYNDTLTANFNFTPVIPGEPNDPYPLLYYRLVLFNNPGVSVSGGGRYKTNTRVNVSASVETGFRFTAWTNTKGDTISTLKSFYFTKNQLNDTLIAHAEYDPAIPLEPGDPILRHHVYISGTDGGSVSPSDYQLEGKNVLVSANVNSGYKFRYWLSGDTVYTTLRSFYHTVGKEDVSFHAVFEFDPALPGEPNMPKLDQYSLYLMTVNGMHGNEIHYPLYLTAADSLADMSFQLKFPVVLMPDFSRTIVSPEANGYTLNIHHEEGDSAVQVSMIGGKIGPTTTALLDFVVTIADSVEQGGNYQVRINQVQVADLQGETFTTRTRNARIRVLKLGDTNGDNSINLLDKKAILNYLDGVEDEDFVPETADVTGSGNISTSDAEAVIDLMFNE